MNFPLKKKEASARRLFSKKALQKGLLNAKERVLTCKTSVLLPEACSLSKKDLA